MQRTTDLLQQLCRPHEQQMATIRPALGEASPGISRRELDEYFRRSQRIRDLERELQLAHDEEARVGEQANP